MAESSCNEPTLDHEFEQFKKCLSTKEMCERLHFYITINQTGPNQNSFEVASASITPTSGTGFGMVRVIDQPMTVTPNVNSTEIGRDQGLVVYIGRDVSTLLVVITFWFTTGKYQGSTIVITGRDPITMTNNREIPIVGGTGYFRMSRGYAIVNQVSGNTATGNSVLEYYMYIVHPDHGCTNCM